MSTLQVELPATLRAELAEDASRRGVSEAAWLEEAAREKLAATKEAAILAERAARGSRDEYLRVLRQVPTTLPVPGDEREVNSAPETPLPVDNNES